MKFRKEGFVCALALSLCIIGANVQAETSSTSIGTIASGYTYNSPAAQSVTAPVDYTTLSPEQMSALVNKIGNKILHANSVNTQVAFQLIDKDVANAYADGSNTVSVYSGLIKYCENEDELAFVIGHEIGHAASSHVIKGAVTNTVASIGANVGKTAVANALGGSKIAGKLNKINAYTGINVSKMAQSSVDVAVGAGTSKVSRNFEDSADALGMDYLAKAGYNPLAGISIMYKIGENYSDFWADHPSTDKRIVTMYKYISDNHSQYAQKGFNTAAYKEASQKYLGK